MGKADLAAELFLTQDMVRARSGSPSSCVSRTSCGRTTENEILSQALTQLRRRIRSGRGQDDRARRRGLASGRDRHRLLAPVRPLRLPGACSSRSTSDGVGKGSGRSIGSFNLFEAL
ncbi:MAG: hypothetical protein ACLR4Z_01830 [Butyricicoccaceae bacterium]